MNYVGGESIAAGDLVGLQTLILSLEIYTLGNAPGINATVSKQSRLS